MLGLRVMINNEFRKERKNMNSNSTAKKKYQSLARKRFKTFADIKHCIDSPSAFQSVKNHRMITIQKDSKFRSIYNQENRYSVEMQDPLDYFHCFDVNTTPDELEIELHDSFFGMPCTKSVTSHSDANIAITESYEFVEMNNNSIHISRVFRSQLTSSFKTTSNRDDMINTKKRQMEVEINKENIRCDAQRILTMLQALKKSVQLSSLDTSKKQVMMKGIVDLTGILNSEEPLRGKYLSQESFGKYLNNKQLPNPIEAFKNI